MRVEVDTGSGFCAGVIRAIKTAEKLLDKAGADAGRPRMAHRTADGGRIFSLGAIVHNEQELARLEAKGLGVIKSSELANFAKLRESKPDGRAEDKKSWTDKGGPETTKSETEKKTGKGKTLLIRAHGEPPSTYDTARTAGFKIVDCTCPVVLKLQKEIKEAALRRQKDPRGGVVVIFGRQGHPEVLGLLGQTDGCAVVIESLAMLQEAVRNGKIDLRKPVEIFSQTTGSPSEYSAVCARLEKMMAAAHPQFEEQGLLLIHDTICTQVSSRHSSLPEFAASHDVIIFVAGKSSSNGKVLCDLCKTANGRTHLISSADELRREWFNEDDSVGVCGATSTPRWLLERVAEAICPIVKN